MREEVLEKIVKEILRKSDDPAEIRAKKNEDG